MKKALCFLPGHHGNYLARLVDISAGLIPDFNFISSNGTAHNNKRDKGNVTFQRVCVGELPWEDDAKNQYDWAQDDCIHELTGKDVSIVWEQDNVFETVYHFFRNVRDRNLEILDDRIVPDAFKMCPSEFKNRNLLVYPKYFNNLNKIDKQMYIDWFVYQFHVVKQLTVTQPRLDFCFKLNWLYSETNVFLKHFFNLLEFLNLEYKVDITEHHKNFLKARQTMFDAKKSKGGIFQSAYHLYLEQPDIDINIEAVGPRYKSYFKKNH